MERKTVIIQCGRHGAVEATAYKMVSTWTEPGCPGCAADNQQRREKQEAAEKANAEKQRQADLLATRKRNSGIPQRFTNTGFETYDCFSPDVIRVADAAVDYAARFPENLKRGTGLILIGNTGTGKTHLACAIARAVIESGYGAATYITAAQACRRVKDTYHQESERSTQQAIDALASPALLILDEIGVQHGTETERNILFEIINERYENLLPTILISNLNLPALAEYVGDRVVDRMKENGGSVLKFVWDSRRGMTSSVNDNAMPTNLTKQ